MRRFFSKTTPNTLITKRKNSVFLPPYMGYLYDVHKYPISRENLWINQSDSGTFSDSLIRVSQVKLFSSLHSRRRGVIPSQLPQLTSNQLFG